MPTLEAPTETVRSYLNAFNDRDYDRLSELLAADVIEHGIHDELHGPDEITGFLDAHFEAFPDYSGETDAMVAADDTVTVRYTVRGTHTGEFEDIEPTGRTAEWTGMAMYRVEDGKIAEVWLEENRLGLLEQLEVVDPPAHLRI
ncbi:ester cyclase [Halomarina rubra]|uniref:Ester cyclase n=1 Tax=Halomarina rubra TaxID=2071873 RepID=A0ABD6AQA4_9EURY|nr:ester cyclase [Halomarina rubra]